jgi:hypothetical protein
MAKNLQIVYCSERCKDAYNNRKKRKLNAGISKVSDANLNKIKELCDNNKNPLLRATELLAYGIDLSTSDEGIEYDPINNRITL